MKTTLKKLVFGLLERVAAHDIGRAVLVRALDGSVTARVNALDQIGDKESPYPGLGNAVSHAASDRNDIVFVTGRFRSGSTLLWNLLRRSGRFTAYYEPFNERRWFDVESRGRHVDPTHRGANDYWAEYDGLGELGELYDRSWIEQRLYMDARSTDVPMRTYIERMVQFAPLRPALQFNRIDFRLPWIRANFPNCRIVHVVRHPRDQWCSTLGDLARFGRDAGGLAEFATHDDFYLNTWVRDLQYQFPFLTEDRAAHPYRAFYYLWKLSYLFGAKYADCTILLEELTENPRAELQRLLDALGEPTAEVDPLIQMVQSAHSGRWAEYADDRWFRDHESHCEHRLRTAIGCVAPEENAFARLRDREWTTA